MSLDDEPDLSALDGARPPPSADNSDEAPATDGLGVAAIVVGCVGLVAFGIVLAIVTAVMATSAGQRARATGRSPENAYIAFGLAALDGVVWLVLHLVFDLRFIAG
jgi:hypothetical protein